eukprot:6551634-Pyramimonas_sp.AAC.1
MWWGYRYIYLVRDGRDVATSFFHHLSNQDTKTGGGFEGDFSEFFEKWNAVGSPRWLEDSEFEDRFKRPTIWPMG